MASDLVLSMHQAHKARQARIAAAAEAYQASEEAIRKQREAEEASKAKIVLTKVIEEELEIIEKRRADAKKLRDDIARAQAKLQSLRNVEAEGEAQKYPLFSDIMYEVGAAFGVKQLDIRSDRRTQNLVVPRQIICYLAKSETLLSLPQIGRFLGGRDHTTVLHSVRKITSQITGDKADVALANKIETIRKAIFARMEARNIHEALTTGPDQLEASTASIFKAPLSTANEA